LDQERAQKTGLAQRGQTGERRRDDLGRAVPRLVRPRSVRFRREAKSGMRGDTTDPRRRYPRIRGPVEGRIDLDDVEEARDPGETIEPTRGSARVHDPAPIRIVPACDTDQGHPM
jgi:hypothetical protein